MEKDGEFDVVWDVSEETLELVKQGLESEPLQITDDGEYELSCGDYKVRVKAQAPLPQNDVTGVLRIIQQGTWATIPE